MKCRICGGKASVNLRQHKLALCKQDFLQWTLSHTERVVKKYSMFARSERILVAVSGGKDSLSLWHILRNLGYQADGLHIALGIEQKTDYSTDSRRKTQEFASRYGYDLHVVDVRKEYGESIPELAARTQRGRGKPCSLCGLVKRHIMNRIARDKGYTVLATGHNLDDEAAVLFGNVLNWQTGYLLRQSPVLLAVPGFARKVKPLCRFYERDMTAYALLQEIAYIYEECPFAIGSTSIYYKELLNKLENERPGAKLNFYLSFLEARKKGLFSEQSEVLQSLHLCTSCGQPTSAPGLCAFCRLFADNKPCDSRN